MRIKVRKNYLLVAVLLLILISSAFFIVTLLKPASPKVSGDKDRTSQAEVDVSSSRAIGNTKAYTDIKSLADTKGVQAAWQYLINTYGKNNSQQITAHDYAHYVGLLIYEKNGISGMSICTPDFAFGCYHGLLDQAFRSNLSQLSQAEQSCRQVGRINSGPYNSCIHGIGHGVASYFKDKDLTNALKTCDKLPDDAPQYCYDGVFMEFSRDALDSFYKSQDPLYPCDSVSPQYTYACGRNQPVVMLNRLHMTYQQIVESCTKTRDLNLKTSCYVALGFQAVYLAHEDPQEIIKTCESFQNKEFEYQCKSAAAGELVFQNVTNWQISSPLICNSLTGTNQQKMCNEYVSKIQQSYGR